MKTDNESQIEAIPAIKAITASGNQQSIDDLSDVQKAPKISIEVYNSLPSLLKSLCSLIQELNRKDVFLVSSLPVIASHLVNVIAPHRDGNFSPDLFTQIIADPASGKGIAAKSKKLGAVLNRELVNQSKNKRRHINSLSEKEKLTVSEPKDRSLFIAANSSSRAIYDALEANDGSGLIFETEIDTMLSATKQEWGNFSDIARKAFHHEALSINRKDENYSIEDPRLSICMTGTFDQFKSMFKSAQNGHFSRYAFYTFEASTEWQSHKPTKESNELDTLLEMSSNELFKIYELLKKREKPIRIELNDKQWQIIDKAFSQNMKKIEDLNLSKYLHASNNRTAIIALRLASIFVVLRTFEKDAKALESVDVLTPNNADMVACLLLADTFIKHSICLYNLLPKLSGGNALGERFTKFYNELPEKFALSKAYEIAETVDTSKRTCRHWLSNFENKFRRIRRGYYRKV